MKRTKTSRTVVVTSTMALTIALGGGIFAHSVANADPAATPSGQTKSDSSSTLNSHKIKPEDGVRGWGPGLQRHSDELTSVLGVSADELKEGAKQAAPLPRLQLPKMWTCRPSLINWSQRRKQNYNSS
ncbi:hypothetical protein Q0F98_13485 [Paenibacillus amylolyticus]|nr:hypothetical protein Q0F98_13485 [Paenibacillus amylolyticus]